VSSSTTSATPAHAPAAGRYRVDPERTTVRFRTRHMFGLGGVTGTVALREGELVVGDPASATTLSAVLDAASFDTGGAKRDADVRSAKYLDASTYPDITFTCEGAHQHNEEWVATGIVTAHGVAAPVDVTLEQFNDTAGTLTLRASARIDRYAHHVTAGKGMAGRWLSLDISSVLTS
jgi:polyisoprenoid-binding protein YceI